MGNLKQTATDSVLESLMTNGTLNASTTEDLGLAVMARRISTLLVLLSSPGTQLSSGLLQPSTITKLVLTASCTPFLTQAWADHPAVLASVACTSGAWVPTSTPHFSRVWTTLVGSTARGGLRRMGQICATSRSLVMVKPPWKQRSWHSSKMVKLCSKLSLLRCLKRSTLSSPSLRMVRAVMNACPLTMRARPPIRRDTAGAMAMISAESATGKDTERRWHSSATNKLFSY